MIKKASYYLAAFLVLTLIAFWPKYLSGPLLTADAYTHLHAVAGMLWLLLLIAQPMAIRVERRSLHRALGRSTYALAPLFVVSGILLANYRFAAMDAAQFQREAFALYLPVHSALLFALCYGLGLYYRRVVAAHSRYMVFTVLPLIDPVFGRIMGFYLPPLPAEWLYQAITYTITDVIAVALLLSYRGARSERVVMTSVIGTFIVAHILWFVFAPSGAWLTFATWFRSLPLT